MIFKMLEVKTIAVLSKDSFEMSEKTLFLYSVLN